MFVRVVPVVQEMILKSEKGPVIALTDLGCAAKKSYKRLSEAKVFVPSGGLSECVCVFSARPLGFI